MRVAIFGLEQWDCFRSQDKVSINRNKISWVPETKHHKSRTWASSQILIGPIFYFSNVGHIHMKTISKSPLAYLCFEKYNFSCFPANHVHTREEVFWMKEAADLRHQSSIVLKGDVFLRFYVCLGTGHQPPHANLYCIFKYHATFQLRKQHRLIKQENTNFNSHVNWIKFENGTIQVRRI